MKDLNYEITLNNTPYYLSLINELYETLNKKQKILSKIRFNNEVNTLLDFHERYLLKHLNRKEDELLREILNLKGWDKSIERQIRNYEISDKGDFDEYQNTIL